jgi:hypothetical protein
VREWADRVITKSTKGLDQAGHAARALDEEKNVMTGVASGGISYRVTSAFTTQQASMDVLEFPALKLHRS